MKNKVFIVISQCPDEVIAENLALALLEERLVACVNWLPGVRSAYWWQRRIERSGETLLIAKTNAGRLATLLARLAELHPYEAPEILAFEVAAGAEPYLQWIDQTLRAGSDAGRSEAPD